MCSGVVEELGERFASVLLISCRFSLACAEVV